MAAGAAVSVVLGALLAPLSLLIPYAGAPDAAMEGWKPRARKSWPLLATANAFLSMGMLTGIAAPLIPWGITENGDYTGVSVSGSLYYQWYNYYYYSSTAPERFVNPLLLGGSVSIFLGILFCLIAWGLSLCAGARVRGVAVHGAYFGDGGCCAPSLPAIQGLAWMGFWLCTSGAIANWNILSLINTYNLYGVSKSSPGAGLLAFSIFCLLISCILFSVTGCCGKCPPRRCAMPPPPTHP